MPVHRCRIDAPERFEISNRATAALSWEEENVRAPCRPRTRRDERSSVDVRPISSVSARCPPASSDVIRFRAAVCGWVGRSMLFGRRPQQRNVMPQDELNLKRSLHGQNDVSSAGLSGCTGDDIIQRAVHAPFGDPTDLGARRPVGRSDRCRPRVNSSSRAPRALLARLFPLVGHCERCSTGSS